MGELDSIREDALRELAPTGTLRVAISISPAASPFFATRDPATGEPRGVTVTLGTEFAGSLGVAMRLALYPNSSAITDLADAGEWDVTFMPADAERAKKVAFSPPYVIVEGTFLVPAGSTIADLTSVDRPGTRVAAIPKTATARSAERFLKHARLVFANTVDEAAEMLRAGQAEAVALSRDSLSGLANGLPGSRLLEGHFHSAGVAGAVPLGRPHALKLLSAFVERAKASGTVRRALDTAGLKYAVVAPPARPA
jgi:polar amino acid transport system substrate-binding protein